MSEGPRHVVFQACFNFRDLGGYPAEGGSRVRWRTVYRSDTLHRVTDADGEVFAALGLRTVIDLRSRTEIDDHGRLEARVEAVDWRNVPMLDNVKLAPRKGPPGPSPPPSLRPGEGYLNIVEQFGESIAEVFELLAQEESLATPETILGFLGEVRSKYRSTSDLLAQWGVGEGQVNALRTRLLEG